MVEESDLNLVKRARNGEREAFDLLVERYQRRVFSVCFGMVRNPDDAMDLVQESFVKAYRNLDRFAGQSSFYTWLYRIATNVCIDFLRKAKRQRTVDYDDGIGREGEVEGDDLLMPKRLGLNPARVLGRRELLGKINEAMGTLSDAHRQILVLREVEDLSYQEIADTLEISVGTVMSRLHHARKNMQKALIHYVGDSMKVDE